MNRQFAVSIVALSAAVSVCCGADESDKLQFNRDIRPILLDACYACHGPDSAARKADLRLDDREAAIDAGAIVIGDADESELIRRILSEDPDEIMPPPEQKKPLSPQQKQTLVRWIAEGGEYQQHWSYIAPVRSEIPSPAIGFEDWPRNEIDNFILATLLKNGLRPAEEADRRLLARRVSLDITGLPPAPELVEAFANDDSADAYEKLVDALLESPDWGEHRARYWLDYARYADTHGIHFDNFREMWSYRAWVIRAFNQNMPFDQFTVENLAGDLLPNPTLDQRIASGFNRCNMTTNEGGIIDEEYAVLYTRDRTETTAQVWMGLTAGCAVCHDHKFDPLTQSEFYQLAAFFNNTTQAVRDGNVKDTPPIIVVPAADDRERFTTLPDIIKVAQGAVDLRKREARSEFNSWLTTDRPQLIDRPLHSEPLHFHATLDEGKGKLIQVQLDKETRRIPISESTSWQDGPFGAALAVQGSVCQIPEVGDFDGDQPFACAAWINVPANDGHGAICARMDDPPGYQGWDFWMQQRRVGMHIISSWPDRGLKVVSKEQVPANEWVHVAASYDGSQSAAGVRIYINGKLQKTNVENNKLRQHSIRTKVPFRIGQRNAGSGFTGAIQDLRVFSRALDPATVDGLASTRRIMQLLARTPTNRTPEEVADVFQFWLNQFDLDYRSKRDAKLSLETELETIKARGTIAHVMQEKSEAPHAFFLERGEYDRRGEKVEPGTPEALPSFPNDAPANRLGLARWLVSDEHPLTSRVTVNRLWQEIFGMGLVRTSGDLGVSGELPSHPELLDWLAVDFRESGWDVKRLVKLIVMSGTYRQSARMTTKKREVDPANRLLSRGPRFRMDAEMVRDYALTVSGLLVRRLGGESVKPYQPTGVWEAIAMTVSNTGNYERDTGDGLYRRSVYTFVKRMAPPASMEIFNAPSREICIVRRERTNTAIQALVTLNDEQFVEAARCLAENVHEAGSSDLERLQNLASVLVFRPFESAEIAVLQESLAKLRGYYQQQPGQAELLIQTGESSPSEAVNVAELAAWTMLCNQAMNLDEVLNK
jgi:Protein of unknown function (DUF1553)/Protein of unknown function (DUF1549)/Concanavalin A-like lectin/glucanases superfamily/Planctomycete cytochrome C